MSWRESYQLRDYVNDVLTNAAMRLQRLREFYVISEHQWHKVPTTDSMVLYVGLAGSGPAWSICVHELVLYSRTCWISQTMIPPGSAAGNFVIDTPVVTNSGTGVLSTALSR